MENRNDVIQDAIQFLERSESGYTPELMADFLLTYPTMKALDGLVEAVGMWCECCPVEVQRALHAIPDIEKTHGEHPFEEPDVRMDRLRAKAEESK